MYKRVLTILAIGCIGASACADSINFIGTGNGLGGFNIHGPGSQNYGNFAGTLKWQATAGSTTVINTFGAGVFHTVCADVTTGLFSPQTVNLIDSLTMDAAHQKAGSIVGYVGSLASNDLGTLSTSNAWALQIAVWEALYDGSTVSSMSDFYDHISTSGALRGNIYMTSVSHGYDWTNYGGVNTAEDDPLFQTAYSYYVNGLNAGFNAVFIDSIQGGQDQFGLSTSPNHHVVTPEPFTMGFGIAGVGLFFARRRKANGQAK